MISGRTAQASDSGKGEDACRGCGVCCELYGHTLRAGAADLERWRVQGRCDVLRRVGPGGELWWADDGSARLDHCPFFSWQGADRGACGAHSIKPAECRGYPTALHGRRCVMGVQFPQGHDRVGTSGAGGS